MGILRGAMIGTGIGAGVGYYNSEPGREWRGAAAGAVIGGVGGAAAMPAARKLGGMARSGAGGMIGKARSKISQARGRYASRGNMQQLGPIQSIQYGPIAPSKPRLFANRAKNSFRDAVRSIKSSGVGFLNSARMPALDQRSALSGIAMGARHPAIGGTKSLDEISAGFIG